jgi:shikimate kinase
MRTSEFNVNPSVDRPIFLIGYRGTGKTTVAQLLAARLGWQWADADEMLQERFEQTIRAIFAAEGEAGFRAKEAAVLDDLCKLSRHVIATGGGVVLRPSNRAKLKSAGRVVWLSADAQTIWNRLQGDATTAERRPPLTVGGLAEVVELLEARQPYYLDCAHITVDTAGQTPERVVDVILEWLSVESNQSAGPEAKS